METDDRKERLWAIRGKAAEAWARAVGARDWTAAKEHAQRAYEAGVAIVAQERG